MISPTLSLRVSRTQNGTFLRRVADRLLETRSPEGRRRAALLLLLRSSSTIPLPSSSSHLFLSLSLREQNEAPNKIERSSLHVDVADRIRRERHVVWTRELINLNEA